MLDDPTSPPILHKLNKTAYTLSPEHVTLKDGTPATILPFTSLSQVPRTLVAFLHGQLTAEIEGGDTYPMMDALPLEEFGAYWFGTFGAVMLRGSVTSVDEVVAPQAAWDALCLGSFYTKPNYPGRSSHVCNAGFLVVRAARNKGVGRLLGSQYLVWAPLLGFTYSVFNLVYETNEASTRIWDSLGFERIGRVKKCGVLKSYPGRKVDAIVYGYDFEAESTG
ncbi:Protein spt10 [Ascochyta rabiei]|nr:Protein spt10 [Ascochyta rabiei]UPX15010.1 Protein spt10 [Ascochyta rabiei]